MEAMLGIFLYSYLYLKLAKHYVFLIISYVFSSTNLEQEDRTGSAPKCGGGGVGPFNVCTYE
jgi:hypothetical protein